MKGPGGRFTLTGERRTLRSTAVAVTTARTMDSPKAGAGLPRGPARPPRTNRSNSRLPEASRLRRQPDDHAVVPVLVLGKFYGVSSGAAPLFLIAFAVGNLAGPLLLGRFFDTVGRRRMIAAAMSDRA
jgi:hypothetical protein